MATKVLHHLLTTPVLRSSLPKFCLVFKQPLFKYTFNFRQFSVESSNDIVDEECDPWESAWLSEDFLRNNNVPTENHTDSPEDFDAEVVKMNDALSEKRKAKSPETKKQLEIEGSPCKIENNKRDYRLQKQRIHATLWMKEIEKQEEAKLADPIAGGGDDIDRLLDSCSDIFDPLRVDFDNPETQCSPDFKSKPDGWETTSKVHEGNAEELSQREESILLNEFERRKSFCMYKIIGFLKTHIISQKRPVDGWQYIIKEIGPNEGLPKDKSAYASTLLPRPFQHREKMAGDSCRVSWKPSYKKKNKCFLKKKGLFMRGVRYPKGFK